MKFLDTTTNSILQSFQTAYYDQIGTKMVIGSEEYTIASIFAYVLAAHAAMINASLRNRYIATAEGVFLDQIASMYNLSREPVTFSNPYYEGVFTFANADSHIFPAGTMEFDIAGHIYVNASQIVRDASTQPIRWICTGDHSESLTSDEILTELEATHAFTRIARLSGLLSVGAEMNDDTFREYIQSNRRLYSVGLAESYEAAVRLACPHIVDAHAIRQREPGYEPGVAHILVKPMTDYLEDDGRDILDDLDIPAALDAIHKLNITSIGTRDVRISVGVSSEVRMALGRVYVSSAYSPTDASRLMGLKRDAAVHYYNDHLRIGSIAYTQDVWDLLKKPLNEISDDPDDFGLSPEDYESVKGFVILGAGGTTSSAIDPAAQQASYLVVTGVTYTLTQI